MDRRFQSASPWEPRVGFSRAIRVGDRILVSGTAPIGPDGETVHGTAYDQAVRCFTVILEAIAELGGGPEHVVRTRMYLVDRADLDDVSRAHRELVGIARPAATQVLVAGLNDPAWKVEIEAEAIVR
ncbi:MAG: RidA family protein [Myxococcota bacterium]